MVERAQEEITLEDVEIIYQYTFKVEHQQEDLDAFQYRFPQVIDIPGVPVEDLGLSQDDMDKLYEGVDLEQPIRERYAKGILKIYSEIGVPEGELIDFIKSRTNEDQ